MNDPIIVVEESRSEFMAFMATNAVAFAIGGGALVVLIIISCVAFFAYKGKKPTKEAQDSPLEQSESKNPIIAKNDGMVIIIETPERPSMVQRPAHDVKDIVLDFADEFGQKGALDLRDPHSTPQTPEDIESESKFNETKRIKLDYQSRESNNHKNKLEMK